jgi:small subunit ribosomal protein S19
MAQRKTGSAGAARRKLRKAKSLIETRAKKEFTLRGYTMEEVMALPFDEQLQLLPSRARRTVVRGLTKEQSVLMERIKTTEKGKAIKTHRREMVILPDMVGHVFQVHAGKEFKTFTVAPEMIGHTFGEFALTRKLVKHGGVGVGATRGSKHLPLK